MNETLSAEKPQHQKGLFIALFIGLVSGFCILNSDVILRMVATWSGTTTFEHCFFVLPLALWLMWERKNKAKQTPIRPDALGLPVLAVAGAVLAVGLISGINLFQQVAFVSVIVSLFWVCLGRPLTKVMLFPLLFLFLMIPVGNEIVPTLQVIVAKVGTFMLNISGIEATREGIMISTSRSLFLVAEACAGLRFLIANIMVGVLFSSILFTKRKKMVAFVGLSILLPILANFIRVYGVMVIAHVSNNKYGVGFDHLVYGWGFFSVVMAFNIWIGYCFRDPVVKNTGEVLTYSAVSKKAVYAHFFAVLLLAPLLSLGVSGWSSVVTSYQQQALQTEKDIDWKAEFSGINPVEINTQALPETAWKGEFYNPDQNVMMIGQVGEVAVRLHIATWKTQFEEHESVYFANRFDDEDRWIRLSAHDVPVSVIDAPTIATPMAQKTVSVPVYTLGLKGGEKILVAPLYAYYKGSEIWFTPSKRKAKQQEFMQTLTMTPAMGSIVYAKFPVEAESKLPDMLKTLFKGRME